MNRGALISLLTLGGIGSAQAHVSGAVGMAHAGEHLWLLLALVPALMLLRPLVRRLARNRRR